MTRHSWTRRDFLGHTALACAAAGLATRGHAAPTAPAPPSEKIALGFIGVGGMGTSNLAQFLDLPDCQTVAVCDTFRDRREKAKNGVDARYGDAGCAMYGDYRELLAREDIDAVVISVQDHWHALIATAAAQAGKDIYCEKPLGVSVEEARKIRDAVRNAGRVFQTGTWQRSQEKFQHACRLVRNGYIGRVHTLEVAAPGPKYQPSHEGSLDPQPVPEGFDWTMWRGPAPAHPYNPGRVALYDWYLIWDYCVGFICNWGVHHLDIAHWGCPRIGEDPFEVECKADYRNQGFTDNINGWDATFTYPDGLTMVFKDTTQQQAGCRFIGEEGWVHVDRSGIWAEPESLLNLTFKDSDLLLTDAKNHGANFLECVRSRRDPVSDVDAALVASNLGILADIAARLEQKLAWDPTRERFTNSDEANHMLHREMHNGWAL